MCTQPVALFDPLVQLILKCELQKDQNPFIKRILQIQIKKLEHNDGVALHNFKCLKWAHAVVMLS